MHAENDAFDDYAERMAHGVAYLAPLLPPEDDEPPAQPLVARLAKAMQPFSAEELEAAKDPHPHAFTAGQAGLFPVGEVTVVAAQGREGKTYSLMAIAAAYARGKRLGGLSPTSAGLVIIYSAEDDRAQYARKMAAQRWLLGDMCDGEDWCNRIIVPNLEESGISEWRELVKVIDRRPIKAPAVTALIDAILPMMSSDVPPALLIFETASTLSDADEDNTGLKVLIASLKQIAKATGVAVVLVHHTSQAAGANLPTLSIGPADIRGATALVYNSRQCFLLVNLGSAEDPYPDSDARTLLRKLAAPGEQARVTALICLDSSKALDPVPLFFRWHTTPYGPALQEIAPSPAIAGQRWRKVLATLHGKRQELRDEAKGSEVAAKVREAVEAVQRLQRAGKPASAKAVSMEAGHQARWADPYLAKAVEEGLLATQSARIPRTVGETTVYVLADDRWGETA